MLQKSSKHVLIYIFFLPVEGDTPSLSHPRSLLFVHNFVVKDIICQYLYTIHQILDPPLTISSLFSFIALLKKLSPGFLGKNLSPSGEKKIPSPCLVKKNLSPCLVRKQILSPCLVGKKLSPQGKTIAPPPIDINWYVPKLSRRSVSPSTEHRLN